VITNDPSPIANQPPGTEVLIDQQTPPPTPTAPAPPSAWWEFFKALIAWVGSVMALLLVPLLLIVPYLIYLMTTSGALSADVLMQDKMFVLLSIIGVIPAHIVTLFIAWAVVTNWRRLPFWKTLGFSWPPTVAPWIGFGICFFMAITLLGAGLLITHFLGGGKTDLDKLIESSFQARVATAIVAVLTAPLVEEIIYRGILYPAIQRLIGVVGAVAVVSIMFAGVHVLQYRNNIGVILVITILSVTLTTIRATSGRLLPSVVVHLIFNGLQSLYLVLEPFITKPEKVEPAPALLAIIRVFHHFF